MNIINADTRKTLIIKSIVTPELITEKVNTIGKSATNIIGTGTLAPIIKKNKPKYTSKKVINSVLVCTEDMYATKLLISPVNGSYIPILSPHY